MLVLKNKGVKFPELYPIVTHIDPCKGENGDWQRGKDSVGGFELRDKVDLMPQQGLQERLCTCDSNLIFICGQATSGKAQPYDAKVLTPNGFVDMGSLKVGDTITGYDGKPQTVLQIFEQGEKDVYRVTFDDGASTECCAEHLWTIRTKSGHNPYSKYKVMQFSDIMTLFDKGKRIAIPICESVEFTPNLLPIDPYLLGLLLGDGHLRKSNTLFATIDHEIIEYIERLGYKVRKRGDDSKCDYQISSSTLTSDLRTLGLTDKLSNQKFIPYQYKYASIEDRLAIIQGLIDTDGSVDKNGHMSFYTVSEQLAKDFQWIIRSLGGRCSISLKHTHYTYNGEKRQGQLCYVLNFYTRNNSQLCKLRRKKERTFDGFRHGKAELRRVMTKYEHIGKKPCRCILVSNEDSLYITDDFIVTHNTFGMMLAALKGVGKKDYTARLISVRLQDSKKGSSIMRDGIRVWGDFSNCEYNTSDYPTFYWKKWNNSIQLIHSNFNVANPPEWEAFQDYAKKQQASYIAIDEATEMKEFKMFALWFMRNRDDSGMKPQMVLSFNPNHEHWTTKMLYDAGYIGDDWFLKPEMDGVTKYFYVMGDTAASIIWGDTREEVAEIANPQLSEQDIAMGLTPLDMVKSFTMFTGEASGNKKLVASTGGQSVANLHAVGGTQRAVVGKAYFGPIDDEKLEVTRQMIHNLWRNPIGDDANMYATLDVSAGGKDSDNCPLIIWRGLQIVAIIPLHVDMKTLVSEIQRHLDLYHVPIENFAFDATGIGYYLQDFTKGQPITTNKRPIQEIDEYGNPVQLESYFNLRSQLIGKTKVMLERGEISIALDKDTILQYGKNGRERQLVNVLFDEINVFISTTRNNKIYYRSKDEYKAKFHASPDLMDTICYRAIFELDARPKKAPEPQASYDAYDAIYQRNQWDIKPTQHWSAYEKRKVVSRRLFGT